MRWIARPGRRDHHGGQLLALLLVAVVVPSACVLWFMAEAVANQAEAARRTVADAYRGQLRLVRARVNGYWQSRAAELEARLTDSAVRDFHRLVTTGAVDSVVVLSREGVASYPTLSVQADDGRPDGMAASLAARDGQALVRSLVQAGQTRQAIDVITSRFLSRGAARGSDPDGRLVAADQLWLLVSLLPPSDARRGTAVQRLTTLLSDYSAESLIPSAQRVFLMAQLESLEVRPAVTRFPTLAAERIAIAFLEAGPPRRDAAGLQITANPDVWQLSTPGKRAVGLYRTGTVQSATRVLLDDQASPAVRFVATPPGTPSLDESIAIGPALPGWEIAFVTTDEPAAHAAARGRRGAYLSIAVAAIGVMAAAVTMLGGAARRQARLAALKTDLVSTVSHELKTPLASMRLLVDALLEDRELDPAKTREYLQLMSIENARLSRLIDNFLTFSRLERNRYQFRFLPTVAADVVREAVDALPESRRGEHAPAVQVADDLPPVVADKDALVTALLNLIDNAYKYAPEATPPTLRVVRDGAHVVFAVEDRGIGIPPREQKRIFRRYYRVDQRLASQTSGSGLGLSIVEAIARAHGGAVRVQSQPDQGSTFALYVPCTAGATA